MDEFKLRKNLSKEKKMKKVLTIVFLGLFVFFMAGEIKSQPIEGKKFEFSLASSFSNIKEKDDNDSTTILNVSSRFGFFVYKGLEIEPEVIITIPDDSENTGYRILLNLAYNFKLSKNTLFFLLGGGGYGNGSELFGWVWDQDMGISVYNFGAGFKYLIGNSAAIRAEYRYSNSSGEKTESSSWGSYTYDLDMRNHDFSIGLSIFF
jgi:opacity protein-like surface antigen